MSTNIEWTDETWNPATGCSRVSSGCNNCYAMNMARRFDGMGHGYDGTTRNKSGVDWTGKINLHEDRLEEPLSWRKPRRVFVCSMSDLFHPAVPFEFIDRVFAVMALAKNHTFQVLTKRPDRMAEYTNDRKTPLRYYAQKMTMMADAAIVGEKVSVPWPLPNVWLGTSCEDQETADERVPELLRCPAAVRFLSCEPLLGPIDVRRYIPTPDVPPHAETVRGILKDGVKGIGWVIAGGESGHDARPMHPNWVRSLRDQCNDADVAFFFKQWGAWTPNEHEGDYKERCLIRPDDGALYHPGTMKVGDRGGLLVCVDRVGKKAAGRTLDGETHDAFPEPVAA